MQQAQKRIRLLLALGLSLALGAAFFIWFPARKGFTIPNECLAAYYEACQSGQTVEFLDCLGEPLRSVTERRLAGAADASEVLRRQAVKNWVLEGSRDCAESTALVDVEETRINGIQRVRFRLDQSGNGWRIVGITVLHEKRPPIPYGTDVRSAAGGNDER